MIDAAVNYHLSITRGFVTENGIAFDTAPLINITRLVWLLVCISRFIADIQAGLNQVDQWLKRLDQRLVIEFSIFDVFIKELAQCLKPVALF